MQIDFHFYAVYALCRLAGKNADEAHTIAFASQYVDDATNGKNLRFTDGTQFNRVLTGHRNLTWGALTQQVQQQVFVAFHYLPSFNPEDVSTPESRSHYITQPNSPMVQKCIAAALASEQPEQLGIALHALADSFSHQNFSGLVGAENDGAIIEQRDKDDHKLSFVAKKIRAALELALPPFGHGEVYNLPDEPYKTWSYQNTRTNDVRLDINNTERCLNAAETIFKVLGGGDFKPHKALFKKMFSFKGNIDDRIRNWQIHIQNDCNWFNFKEHTSKDKKLTYNEDLWFDEAIKTTYVRRPQYTPRPGFEDSHYFKFHQAARTHRKIILEAIKKAKLVIKRKPVTVFFNALFFVLATIFSLESRKSLSFKAFKRGAFRFAVYGALMTFGEIFFYTLCKTGREIPILRWLFEFNWQVDPRLHLENVWHTPIKVLYGQASLWMVLVYASIALFGLETATKKIKHWFWVWRGLIYMSIILFMEWVTGWMLFYYVGYDIWYYNDPSSRLLIYTSLYIAPLWFIIGLMSENFTHLIIKYSEKKVQLRRQGIFHV